jgi:hypothetical protein
MGPLAGFQARKSSGFPPTPVTAPSCVAPHHVACVAPPTRLTSALSISPAASAFEGGLHQGLFSGGAHGGGQTGGVHARLHSRQV